MATADSDDYETDQHRMDGNLVHMVLRTNLSQP